MGGQGVERREILRYIRIASVAATFPGFQRGRFACSASPSPAPAARQAGASYKPLFFPKIISSRRAPRRNDYSSRRHGRGKGSWVGEFIDFMVANRVAISPRSDIRSTADAIRQGENAQVQLVAGLDWINARSKSMFEKQFLDCTSEQQTNLLEELAYKAKFNPLTEDGREFFPLMRDHTVVGYYTSRVWLESLGYPGLRTVWPKMPGCTHLDDPEHLHLGVAK